MLCKHAIAIADQLVSALVSHAMVSMTADGGCMNIEARPWSQSSGNWEHKKMHEAAASPECICADFPHQMHSDCQSPAEHSLLQAVAELLALLSTVLL